MTPEQLQALCATLVVLLGVSEALPFIKKVRSNSWGQLLISVLVALSKPTPRR